MSGCGGPLSGDRHAARPRLRETALLDAARAVRTAFDTELDAASLRPAQFRAMRALNEALGLYDQARPGERAAFIGFVGFDAAGIAQDAR